MRKNQNVSCNYAFIDSQNLNLAVRDQGWILDFKKFRVYLKEKYKVKKAFLFLGYVPENYLLYRNLKNYGYDLIFKPTVKDNLGKVKGNIDAELVLQVMTEYKNYQKAVIVSGDGDFYCLVDYLFKRKKLRKLLIPNSKKYSKLLKHFAPNKLNFMNNLKQKLEYKKRLNRR